MGGEEWTFTGSGLGQVMGGGTYSKGRDIRMGVRSLRALSLSVGVLCTVLDLEDVTSKDGFPSSTDNQGEGRGEEWKIEEHTYPRVVLNRMRSERFRRVLGLNQSSLLVVLSLLGNIRWIISFQSPPAPPSSFPNSPLPPPLRLIHLDAAPKNPRTAVYII